MFLLFIVRDDTHSNSLSVVSLFFLFGSLKLSSFLLLSKFLLEDFLLLHFVNSFNEDGLVLEEVTLASKVEMMVDLRSDFLGFSIFSKKSSKNSLSSHPKDLYWHSSVSGTLSLTESSMSSLSLGFMHSLAS